MLLNVSIPHEPFNTAVKDGTAGQKLGRIVDEIKPEAVYFTEQHGQRGAVMIVEMSDASKIPALAEPWFLTFNANVEFRVVMTPDDLQKAGLDGIGKKWVCSFISWYAFYLVGCAALLRRWPALFLAGSIRACTSISARR
jgi:hypothetical protein